MLETLLSALADFISTWAPELYVIAAILAIWFFLRVEHIWECPEIDRQDEELETRQRAFGGKRPTDLPEPDAETEPGATVGTTRASGRGRRAA